MTDFSGYVKEHRIFAYFFLAFLIAWSVWFIEYLLSGTPKPDRMVLQGIGCFAPAMAAIIVSFIISPGPVEQETKKRWGLFAVVYIVCLPVILLNPLANGDISDPLYVALNMVMTGLVAFIISGIFSSSPGIRNLTRPLLKWKVGIRWYLVAIFLFLIIPLLANRGALLIFGTTTDSMYPTMLGGLGVFGLILFAVNTFLVGGPLGEEVGWRGFALPNLQKYYSPLIASLILGVLWMMWHLPLHFIFYPGDLVTGILFRFLWGIPTTVIFTWIYNNTAGSLFIAILFHTSIDVWPLLIPSMMTQTPADYLFWVLIIAVAVIVIIHDRMWEKLPGTIILRKT